MGEGVAVSSRWVSKLQCERAVAVSKAWAQPCMNRQGLRLFLPIYATSDCRSARTSLLKWTKTEKLEKKVYPTYEIKGIDFIYDI
jgi:hypothetical protein